MNPEAKNILVFRFGQIGDTVAALPSLWALRKQFAGARIVILSEIPAKESHLPPETVLPKEGLVDGFEKYPGGASIGIYFASWRKIRRLRKQGFDTLVYLTPSGRTKRQRLRDQLFFRLCGIQHILGIKGFAENLRPRLSDGTLAWLPKEADALLERLKLDGLSVPATGQGCMDLQITEIERENAGNWWKQNVGSQDAPNGWMAICPGGKVSSKLWPVERYAEVIQLLVKQHKVFPVIIGGKEDRIVATKLLVSWKTGVSAAGELSVRESAALMETAQFYLGNDTGVMHLAAAVGIPCVGIFSARDWPGRWHPYGDGHKVLRFDVPCSGCRLEVCNQQLQCLRGIEAGQVYGACIAVMKQRNII